MTNDETAETPEILVDLCPVAGVKKVSMKPADLGKQSAEAIDAAMTTVRAMAGKVADTIDKITKKPSEVEVTFGLKLDAESRVFIAKVGVEAQVSVKLKWIAGN